MAIDIDLETGQPIRKGAAASANADKVSARASAIWTLGQRPDARDRILFTEGLALQLATGVTLHSALQSLQAQTEKPCMKAVIADLIDHVVGGGKFSEALARHHGLFSCTYVNLVAVAEGGGFMTDVLDQLKEMDEKEEKLRAAIVSAFSYPAFLVTFSVAVVVFVLMVVFPKFAVMFASMHADLPVTTRALMWTSDMLLRYPLPILGTVAAAVAVVAIGLRRKEGRLWLDRLKLTLPLLRTIYVQIYLTRLMRAMGISLQHGVTVLATLTACREVVPNAGFQTFIARLESEVMEGKGIAAGFADTSFIPASVIQMIATGEEAGKLGHVMGRIADFYDRELTKRLHQLSKLAEPVMLLVMGGVVGVIVSSLILPIFKMSRAMS